MPMISPGIMNCAMQNEPAGAGPVMFFAGTRQESLPEFKGND
jgi:hypothetical protein